MEYAHLSSEKIRAILKYLSVSGDLRQPDRALLNQIVKNYVRTVPFENISRIIKRANTARTADCPRWPVEFWQETLENGCGGTCFESQYALFPVLQYLGFQSYLTVNDMSDCQDCHAAIVVILNGEKWVVDVTLPLYAPIPLSIENEIKYTTEFMTYTVRAVEVAGVNHFQIKREPHPFPYAYTLIDKPVPNEKYREILTNDYGECGFFLDRVVINKVVNGLPWRFNSAEKPHQLNMFENGNRTDYPLNGKIAESIAKHFGMDAQMIEGALDEVQ